MAEAVIETMRVPLVDAGAERRAVLLGAVVGRLVGVLDDIARMRRTLEPWGFDCTAVVESAATRDGILGALRELVAWAERVGSAAVVVIYYSGHGGQSELRSREGKPQGRTFSHLVPVDIEAAGGWHGVADFELAALLDELTRHTKNVTLILDCCYSAAIREADDKEGLRAVQERTVTLGASQEEWFERAMRSHVLDPEGNPDVVRVVAAASASLAYEATQPDGRPGGYLTYELCKALGEARGLRLPWQTIVGQVRERVRANGKSVLQRPEVSGPRWRLPFSLEEAPSAGEQSVLAYDASKRPWMRTGRLHGLGVGDEVEVAWGLHTVKGWIVEMFDDTARLVLDAIGNEGSPPPGSAVVVRGTGVRKRVRIDASARAVEGLRQQLSTSSRLVLVEEDTSDFVVTLDQGGLVVSGRGIVRRWPRPPTEEGIAALVDDVDGLARSAILLDVLELPHTERHASAEGFEVDAFVMEDAADAPRKLESGETVPEGAWIYVEVRRPAQGRAYVNVLDRGVTGRIALVSDGEPMGVELPGQSKKWIGRRPQGGLPALRLAWPQSVPRGVEGWEEILVVVSERPLDLRPLLERPQVERGAQRHSGGSSVELELKLRWIVFKMRFRIEPAPERDDGAGRRRP